METTESLDILSKEELWKLISNKIQFATIIINSKKYQSTFNYINNKYINTCTGKFIEKLYQYFNNIDKPPICVCGKPMKCFYGFNRGYASHCCSVCAGLDLNVKNKRSVSMLKKYGISHAFEGKYGNRKCDKTSAFKYNSLKNFHIENAKKAKITRLKKYGFEFLFQSKEMVNKRKLSNFIKHGDENYCNKDLIRQRLIERYNSDKYWQYRKSSYKDYTLPSGKIVKLQGYEPMTMDFLLKIYSENDIIFNKKEIPKFEYELNNVKHTYFPDFYIPSENLIIETKSEWTLNNSIEIFNLKKQSVINKGFNFKTMLFNNCKKLIKYE